MTIRDAVHFIRERLTYKPGYTLSVHGLEDRLELSVSVPTGVDAKGLTPGQYDVTYTELFTVEEVAHVTEDQLIEMVYWVLVRWERHECDEWFKLDGVAVRDPHSTSVNFVNGRPV